MSEPNLMWWGKLNQRKIWKTEPMENLPQSSCTFKCRKVIMCKCPCINILKFFQTIDIYKMTAIFLFFILADTDIPFPLTLGEPETQTFGGW